MSSWNGFTTERFIPQARAFFGTPHEPGGHRHQLAKQSRHSPHRTECRDCKASDAALRRSRAGVPKVCAASERHRPAISTCEGRCRRNVLSAWNVVSSSSATGLSPVVHPPSRPTDLQSPQRTSVETCRQTSHDENVVENWSWRLIQERDHHAGRPSCNGHGLDPPRTLPVSRPVIHAHRGEHHRNG